MEAVERIEEGLASGVPVISLVGELGAGAVKRVDEALSSAFRTSGGQVLLDLRPTTHLHYRIASNLVRAAHSRRRLGIVGPTPYVRQILVLAGAREDEIPEYRDLGEALEVRRA